MFSPAEHGLHDILPTTKGLNSPSSIPWPTARPPSMSYFKVAGPS